MSQSLVELYTYRIVCRDVEFLQSGIISLFCCLCDSCSIVASCCHFEHILLLLLAYHLQSIFHTLALTFVGAALESCSLDVGDTVSSAGCTHDVAQAGCRGRQSVCTGKHNFTPYFYVLLHVRTRALAYINLIKRLKDETLLTVNDESVLKCKTIGT